MKNALSLILVLLSFFVFTGCEDDILSEAEEGNFILYVSNQSFDNERIDIKVYIDGLLAVDEIFYVEDQHNWKQYQFNLSEGIHTIKVKSKKGDATYNQAFVIADGQQWGVLDYWTKKKGSRLQKWLAEYFTFKIYAEPVYFM